MSRLTRDVTAVVSSKAIVRVTQALAFVVLARTLSPSEFAWFGIITTAIITGTTLGSLGLRQSLATDVGRGTLQRSDATTTALVMVLPLSLLTALVVWSLYGGSVPGISAGTMALIVLVGICSTMALMLLQGPFLGAGDISKFIWSNAAPRVTFAAFVIGAAIASITGLTAALISYAAGFALLAPLMAFVAFRAYGVGRPELTHVPRLVRSGIAFAVNLSLIGLMPRIGVFVLERRSSPDSAGQFFAAARYSELLLEVATAIGIVLFSYSARATNASRAVERSAAIACTTGWLFTLLGIIALPVAIWGLPALLGPGYAGTGTVFLVITLGIGFSAANKILYPSIAGSGRPLLGTPIIIGGIVLNAALAWYLTPSLAATGAAIATIVSQSITYVGFALIAYGVFDAPRSTLLLPDLTRVRAAFVGRRT